MDHSYLCINDLKIRNVEREKFEIQHGEHQYRKIWAHKETRWPSEQIQRMEHVSNREIVSNIQFMKDYLGSLTTRQLQREGNHKELKLCEPNIQRRSRTF